MILPFSNEENEAQGTNWNGRGKFGEVTKVKRGSKALHV